jgi:glycosyltransferase involved in cell wall biosynthesis
MTQKPKIAIIHDAFLYRGGGERLVTLMAKSLDADLISGFFSEGSFDPRELGFTGRMIPLGKPVFAKGIRHMLLKWRFFWHARMLAHYDIVIFSGDCLGALRHVRKDAKAYYYCHTPPRYLYDFRARYLAKMPVFLRPLFGAVFSYFAHVYEGHLARFTGIVTNSHNVQNRLRSYTGYDSTIIYPPIDTTFFVPSSLAKETPTLRESQNTPQSQIPPIPKPQNYFFSWARLSPPKRVGMIIDAFL